MDANLFYLEWYTRELLEAARATAWRESLVDRRRRRLAPLAAAVVAGVKRRAVRWAAAWRVSKPTAAGA